MRTDQGTIREILARTDIGTLIGSTSNCANAATNSSACAATAKSIDILSAAGCTAFIVQLPPGEDPDTFVRSHGRGFSSSSIARSRRFSRSAARARRPR